MIINMINNTMISPLSIYQFLCLLSNETIGNTQKELLQILFPEKELEDKTNTLIEKINYNNIEIISNIESEDLEDDNYRQKCSSRNSKIRFNDVNGIFIKNDLKLSKQFTQISDKYNTSYFEELSAKIVNEFYKNNTNGKIKNVIGFIPPSAKLYFIKSTLF